MEAEGGLVKQALVDLVLLPLVTSAGVSARGLPHSHLMMTRLDPILMTSFGDSYMTRTFWRALIEYWVTSQTQVNSFIPVAVLRGIHHLVRRDGEEQSLDSLLRADRRDNLLPAGHRGNLPVAVPGNHPAADQGIRQRVVRQGILLLGILTLWQRSLQSHE